MQRVFVQVFGANYPAQVMPESFLPIPPPSLPSLPSPLSSTPSLPLFICFVCAINTSISEDLLSPPSIYASIIYVMSLLLLLLFVFDVFD